MRKWKVIGYKNVQYKSRNTGKDVSGTELHVVSEPVSPNMVGLEAKVCWLGQHVTYKPTEGQFVHICYDERGNIDEVFAANT